MTSRSFALVIAGVALAAAAVNAQQVTKQQVPGITNFARLETTIACGGVTKPEALTELKKMGFAAVFNLRLPTESGAAVDEEGAAVKAAGMKYVHIPYDTNKADPAVADAFLAEIQTPGNQPAYIHCAGGSRAAGMWMIKRMVIDKWDAEKAGEEAAQLGLNNARLKQFALEYAAARK